MDLVAPESHSHIKTIHASLEIQGRKLISVATSEVATSQIHHGQTAHSTFKKPVPLLRRSYFLLLQTRSLGKRLVMCT